MNWKRLVREYFSYNDFEKKNIIGLFTLLFLIICTRFILAFIPVDFNKTKISEELLAKASASIVAASSEKVIEYSNHREEAFVAPDSMLDLNTVSAKTLEQTGLRSSISQRIIAFRTSQHGFNQVDQLYQVYGVDSAWVDSIKKYVFLDTEFLKKSVEVNKSFSQDTLTGYINPPKLNLNTADSMALLGLKGLGPFFVKEIIKLRENLGGIRDYSQLLEIYRMTDETISLIADQTYISEDDFHFINLNTVDVNRLGRHPYLTWKQAKTIVNYRFQHGGFSEVEDIKKTKVVNDSVYYNIRPYLVVE